MREETKEQSIRVVLVEPGKYARCCGQAFL